MKYYVYTTDEKDAIDNYSDILTSEDDVEIDEIRNLLKRYSAYEFNLVQIGKPEFRGYFIPYDEEGFYDDISMVALHDKNGREIKTKFDN